MARTRRQEAHGENRTHERDELIDALGHPAHDIVLADAAPSTGRGPRGVPPERNGGPDASLGRAEGVERERERRLGERGEERWPERGVGGEKVGEEREEGRGRQEGCEG